MKWFWERTLCEIKNQPAIWSCFVLIVFGAIAGLAILIVAATTRRRRNEISPD